MNAPQTKLSVPNEKALKELSDYLQMQSQLNQAVTIQNLKSRYTKKPFGWALLDIAGLVADLVADNQVQFCYNGAVIPPNDKLAVDYLTNDKKIQSVEIKVKTQIDSAVIKQITMLARDLFETQNLSDDGEKLSVQVKDVMSKTIEDLQELKAQHNNPAYPDKSVIEIGIEIFKRIKSEPDTLTFFNLLINQADALKDWKEQYKLVKSFFNSQKRIFDEALEVHNLIENSKVYMDIYKGPKMDELREIHEKIAQIINNNKPYSLIKELPPLTQQLKTVYKDALDGFKDVESQVTIGRLELIKSEAEKQGLDSAKYVDIYKNTVSDFIDCLKDFGQMTAFANKGRQKLDEILVLINNDAQPVVEPDTAEQETVQVKQLEFVNPVSIVGAEQVLETEQDVDDYINKLSAELKAKIRNNKRIRLQG